MEAPETDLGELKMCRLADARGLTPSHDDRMDWLEFGQPNDKGRGADGRGARPVLFVAAALCADRLSILAACGADRAACTIGVSPSDG